MDLNPFYKKNKALIDALFNAALLKAHNSTLEACGIMNVKRPKRKIINFNSLVKSQKKTRTRKTICIREKIEQHPELYDRICKKRMTLEKEPDFLFTFSKTQSAFKTEYVPKIEKELSGPKIKPDANFSAYTKLTPQVQLTLPKEHPYNIPLDCMKKNLTTSYRKFELDRINKDIDKEFEELCFKKKIELEECAENDFYGGIIQYFSEEEIMNKFAPDKLSEWKELHEERKRKESKIIQRHKLKHKSIKNKLKEKIAEINAMKEEELISNNKENFEEQMKVEKEKHITILLDKKVLEDKLQRGDLNNGGLPQSLRYIPWNDVLFRRENVKRNTRGINSILETNRQRIKLKLKIKPKENKVVMDKVMEKLQRHLFLVGNNFVDPCLEDDIMLKKKRKINNNFYLSQCPKTKGDIVVPGTPD